MASRSASMGSEKDKARNRKPLQPTEKACSICVNISSTNRNSPAPFWLWLENGGMQKARVDQKLPNQCSPITMKLKFEFSSELALKQTDRDIASMTALFPLSGGRAIAFGWVHFDSDGTPSNERYWLAEISREGVTKRILPTTLVERLVELTGRRGGTDGSDMHIQAFRYGKGVGLLLGTQEVHLYSTIHDEPRVIAIENPFTGLGTSGRTRPRSTDPYFPQHCGHSHGNLVPVILGSPGGGIAHRHHASLLEVNADTGQARWLVTSEDGTPPGVSYSDYALFFDAAHPGSLQISTGLPGKPPMILDTGWTGDAWQLYIGGFSPAYHRFGLPPSVLSRNRPDLSLISGEYQAKEESFGRICASQDRLILTPLRKNGLAKGKQSVYLFADQQEVVPTLPRGYTKYSIVEYLEGYWWLLPMPMSYMHTPLVACSEG